MTAQTISKKSVACVLPFDAIVGESPVWHPAQQRLYWIDIQRHTIYRFDPSTGKNEAFPLPEMVTCIQLRQRGGLGLTLRKEFALFDPDTARLERLARVEEDVPGNRFNDGKCDPQGRFWAGTMDDKNWQNDSGNLYRMDAHGSIEKFQSQVICSNGLGWSPDGKTMYFTESFRYAIFAYDFNGETGKIDNRRLFAELQEEDRRRGAFPDGMTVDAEGGVWSNLVGAGKIVRYDPQGAVERTLELPVPRAPDCTFGGPDLATLYITSGREKMTAEDIRQYPLAGSLFAADVGVKGLPPTPYAG